MTPAETAAPPATVFFESAEWPVLTRRKVMNDTPAPPTAEVDLANEVALRLRAVWGLDDTDTTEVYDVVHAAVAHSDAEVRDLREPNLLTWLTRGPKVRGRAW